MDVVSDPITAFAMTMWLLVMFLNAKNLLVPVEAEQLNDVDDEVMPPVVEAHDNALSGTLSLMQTTLLNFRVSASLNVFHDEVMYWVKPRSTTWFSKFLMEQYNHSRWVSMFRMTKPAVFALAKIVRPHVETKNTRYRLAVPVLVRVACTLFKLSHGANLTIVSEMFAVGRSTVCKILREVVHSINECLKHKMTWPTGRRLRSIQRKFMTSCSLPGVVGALDGVHISIAKPHDNAADYYYFKSGGYSLNCHAVVDSDKRFLDLCVGMPGSTNDSRVLWRSTLFHLATTDSLFVPPTPMNGFLPFLIADSGYPLLPWLMTPHRQGTHLLHAARLLNKKLKKGRVVVENAFRILKQSFRELLGKSDLHLTFLPDVVMCCAILHNILLSQSPEEVEHLFRVLDAEGPPPEDEAPPVPPAVGEGQEIAAAVPGAAANKRRDLGDYLLRTRGLRREQV